MKVKTFILTFLMMSCPFLFGQSHWVDPILPGEDVMTVTAKVTLDGTLQSGESYEVAVFNAEDNKLVEVGKFTNHGITELEYHVGLSIPGAAGDRFYFKFFNGTYEYVSLTEIDYVAQQGSHLNLFTIEFKSVAQIEGTEFDVVYPSLQKAIDAAANGDVVTLLEDNAENVTVVQAPDVAFTIEGAEKTMSGTITVNGKSNAYETAGLTIQNVNFDATNISKDASINLGDGETTTRYTNGVTVQDCDFTGNGQTKVAIKNYTGGCENLTVTGGTFTGLHSLMQVKGVDGLTITGVTVENSGRGISVGTSTNVEILNSTFDVNSYGVRADGGDYTMTLTNNNISAELPVVVRKAAEYEYNLTIAGDNNNFTAKQQDNNPEGYQVVFTTGDDGTYLAPTTGQFLLSVPENFNVYPVYVAQVGNLKYTSVDAALTAAQPGDVVQIFAGTYNQALNINKAITVEGERGENGEYLVIYDEAGLSITADGATVKDIYVYNPGGNGVYVNAKDVLIEGCDIAGNNGARSCYTKGTVTFRNSYIGGATYGIHFDGSANGNIVIEGCQINGWTSFASTITNVAITDTDFLGDADYRQLRFYQDATLNNVTFPAGMRIDTGNGGTGMEGIEVKFNGCSIEGGNLEDAFPGSVIAKSDIYVDNVLLKREAKIGDTYYETLADAYTAATDGQTITLLADITLSEIFVIEKSITFNGNGKTLTSTAGRAINVSGAGGVTIKDLTINASGERAINVIQNATNVTIDGVTATAANYTVNVAASAPNAVVAINNSILNGLCTVNVSAAGSQVTVDNSTVNCNDNDTTAGESYAALCLNKEAVGGSIVATNSTINVTEGSDSTKGRNGAENGTVTINGSTEGVAVMVAVITYEGSAYYYSFATLKDAIEFAKTGDVVTLIRDVTIDELVKIEKAVTLDLNGKTVTANCKKAFEVYANATIKNGTIWSQQRCVDTRKNVELTLADVTLEAPTYYSTHQNQQPLTIGGSDNGTKVTMTNVNIDAGTIGYAIISYVKTDLTATNSNFSGYSALYVKEGSEGSEFNFVGSTLKGDLGSNDVEGNSFATIATEADDVTVTLDANSKLKSYGQNHLAISVESVDNEITVTGVIEATNFLDGSTNVNANTIKVKAEYAGKLLAEGYVTTADDNGLVKVSGLAVAKIGETYYATLDEAFAAAQNGNEVKILVAGTYALNTSGKNIAITGAVDGVVFDNIGAKNMGGANVTFNNVTFDYYPNVNYTGLQHSGNLVYNDCTFEGQPFLYGTSETFNKCTFNQNSADAYNVWTYGAKEVAFNECTFNSVGKSVLIYTESATTYNEVAVTKCTFNASSPVDGKAAIEMDSSLSAGINLTIDGATTATGFGSGNVSGNSLWNNKKGNNDMANNDITVVVNDVTVLKPWAPVAKIGETPYETLAKAISAATAGETITICSDVNENVTVNKNLTIDGANDEAVGGKFNYTGTMTANAGLTVTVQNIDFVGGGFDKSTKSTTGTYTFKDCTFDGAAKTYAYPLKFKGANKIIVENCTVKDYMYSFLYITSGTNSVSVKNVTVEDCPSYAVYFASGVNTATIENLTVKNSNNGFVINNTANRALTLKNCKLENVGTAVAEANGTNTITCTLLGNENNFGTSASSQYAKYVLAEADATLISPENLTVNVTTDLDNQGYVVEYNAGVYSVVPGNILNQTTDKKYAKLQAAIDEASENDVIVLLKDITENVTITKHLTIDGKAADATANSKYTGTMTVNAQLNVTVQDIDFDKGCINDPGDAHGYLTIKNCNFDGVDKSIGYAVTVRGGDKLTIENSTAKNYSTGMLYIPSAVANIDIKDVEVSNVAAAFNITYSGDGTFENVKLVENVTYGIHFQIYGSRTYTVKNCDLKGATNPFWFWDKSNNTAKVTVVFEGDNDLGTKGITVNAGELQLATDATLTAAEGLTIKATEEEEGYVVEYNEGVYSVVAGNILNQTTGKKYATIQDAINAAENGDKIVVLENVDLSTNECVLLDNSYNTYFKVEGKTVTVDLNGMTINGEYASSPMLVGVFSTDNNGHLTLEDSSDEKTGAVNVTTAEGYTVYSLIANYEPGCSITINGGTYTLDKAHDSHIYSGSTNGETEGVTVNGGVFKLGNVGTGTNGKPWMFNVLGSNDGNVVVKGGTFDADINHQFWAKEVYVPETLALQNNGNGTWTVVKSVAYVEETATSTGSTVRKVGYATIEDAIEAIGIRNTNETVTMLKDVELAESLTIAAGKEVILDLNGKVVSMEDASAKGAYAIKNNGNLTIKDSAEGGKITFNSTTPDNSFGYATSTIGNGGHLTIENGLIENTTVGGASYAVDGIWHTGEASLTINDGTITATKIAVRQVPFSATAKNTVTINGGTLTGATAGLQMFNINNDAKLSETNIYGGTFNGTYAFYTSFTSAQASELASISIDGGTFNGYVFLYNGQAGSEDYPMNVNINSGNFNAGVYVYTKDAEGNQVNIPSISGGVFTTAAKEDTDETLLNENFAFVDNGDGTWTVMPSQEQSLVKGWNWYSTYLDIELNDLTTALGDNGSYIKNSRGISVENIGNNMWLGELTTISPSEMYLVQTTEECDLKLAADLVNPSNHLINLNSGWSWIGYPSNQEGVAVGVALANIPNPKEGDLIKTLNNGYAEYAFGYWLGTLNTMVPGIGYKYHNTSGEVKTFYYNIETTTRGAVEANVTAENNYWTPNATKYPFNMTMTAVVDGLADGNYEVAAFVNGELRGSARPIYVEALDTYMFFLTIHGEDVEEMSFRLYDIDNDTEYDLSDRINYSNDAHLGSVNEPYVFSRGTTGIGEASMSEVNIYPNPTTTGTEINLEATCDKVEVFNALGVKVVEYQNVDTIDALETAGIYVIRITNDGNVQNCRLVVK